MSIKKVTVREKDNSYNSSIPGSHLRKCSTAAALLSSSPTTLADVEIKTFASFVDWLERYNAETGDSLSRSVYVHDNKPVLQLMKMYQFSINYGIAKFGLAIYLRLNTLLKLPRPYQQPNADLVFTGIFGRDSQSTDGLCIVGLEEIEYVYANMPQLTHIWFQFVRSFMVVQSQGVPVVDLLLDYPHIFAVDIAKRRFELYEREVESTLVAIHHMMGGKMGEDQEEEES